MKPDCRMELTLQRLRELELYAYQVAHFLLKNDRLAEEAAKAALLEISRTDKLAETPAEELRLRMRKQTIRASLHLAGTALTTS
ncbi:hypothetical protein KP806_04430 [Paenibacillus sp. N4]|uniref:hypothetical protein n=1 Tax=Paenibacillus vietnamensis TaxID=2590547 RepID=UPI001CD1302D|nr:hypothetical protein [Paenibacillus vietnamensis]MCA0754283.1 hypothetical protein [Paenibacillus vietnamensis]